MKKICKVVSLPFEGQHFGLVDHSGNKYLPIDFPQALRREGLEVECEFIVMNHVDSFINWGTTVRIISSNRT